MRITEFNKALFPYVLDMILARFDCTDPHPDKDPGKNLNP